MAILIEFAKQITQEAPVRFAGARLVEMRTEADRLRAIGFGWVGPSAGVVAAPVLRRAIACVA